MGTCGCCFYQLAGNLDINSSIFVVNLGGGDEVLNCKSSNCGGGWIGWEPSICKREVQTECGDFSFLLGGGGGEGRFNALGYTSKHWHSLSVHGQSRVFHSIVPRR